MVCNLHSIKLKVQVVQDLKFIYLLIMTFGIKFCVFFKPLIFIGVTTVTASGPRARDVVVAFALSRLKLG